MAKEKRSFGLRLNIWMLKATRNWLKITLTIVGLYAIMPWVAPTLMHLGLRGPANVLYTIYSPMCHQFAFRSVFLYGEQTFYPREIADTNLRPYEAYSEDIESLPNIDDPTSFEPELIWSARGFRGNEQMGYKTTLCARDVAIYLALFGGGLIYAVVRRRLRPVPFLLYIFIGLGPIGLDGFSQLLSYSPFNFWEVRETEPFFRVTTGAIFGLMNAWLGFPYLDRSMQDTRRQIEAKLLRAGYKV